MRASYCAHHASRRRDRFRDGMGRALLVDVATGRELASAVFPYVNGVIDAACRSRTRTSSSRPTGRQLDVLVPAAGRRASMPPLAYGKTALASSRPVRHVDRAGARTRTRPKSIPNGGSAIQVCASSMTHAIECIHSIGRSRRATPMPAHSCGSAGPGRAFALMMPEWAVSSPRAPSPSCSPTSRAPLACSRDSATPTAGPGAACRAPPGRAGRSRRRRGRHRGRLVLRRLPHASDAVRAAVAIQRSLAAEPWPAGAGRRGPDGRPHRRQGSAATATSGWTSTARRGSPRRPTAARCSCRASHAGSRRAGRHRGRRARATWAPPAQGPHTPIACGRSSSTGFGRTSRPPDPRVPSIDLPPSSRRSSAARTEIARSSSPPGAGPPAHPYRPRRDRQDAAGVPSLRGPRGVPGRRLLRRPRRGPDGTLVASSIARTLGVQERPDRETLERSRATSSRRRCCSSSTTSSSSWMRSTLVAISCTAPRPEGPRDEPEALGLAASTISGSAAFPPRSGRRTIRGVSAYEAVALFVERARCIDPASSCPRTRSSPRSAHGSTACRSRSSSPRAGSGCSTRRAAARLDDRLALLTGGGRPDPHGSAR